MDSTTKAVHTGIINNALNIIVSSTPTPTTSTSAQNTSTPAGNTGTCHIQPPLIQRHTDRILQKTVKSVYVHVESPSFVQSSVQQTVGSISSLNKAASIMNSSGTGNTGNTGTGNNLNGGMKVKRAFIPISMPSTTTTTMPSTSVNAANFKPSSSNGKSSSTTGQTVKASSIKTHSNAAPSVSAGGKNDDPSLGSGSGLKSESSEDLRVVKTTTTKTVVSASKDVVSSATTKDVVSTAMKVSRNNPIDSKSGSNSLSGTGNGGGLAGSLDKNPASKSANMPSIKNITAPTAPVQPPPPSSSSSSSSGKQEEKEKNIQEYILAKRAERDLHLRQEKIQSTRRRREIDDNLRMLDERRRVMRCLGRSIPPPISNNLTPTSTETDNSHSAPSGVNNDGEGIGVDSKLDMVLEQAERLYERITAYRSSKSPERPHRKTGISSVGMSRSRSPSHQTSPVGKVNRNSETGPYEKSDVDAGKDVDEIVRGAIHVEKDDVNFLTTLERLMKKYKARRKSSPTTTGTAATLVEAEKMTVEENTQTSQLTLEPQPAEENIAAVQLNDELVNNENSDSNSSPITDTQQPPLEKPPTAEIQNDRMSQALENLLKRIEVVEMERAVMLKLVADGNKDDTKRRRGVSREGRSRKRHVVKHAVDRAHDDAITGPPVQPIVTSQPQEIVDSQKRSAFLTTSTSTSDMEKLRSRHDLRSDATSTPSLPIPQNTLATSTSDIPQPLPQQTPQNNPDRAVVAQIVQTVDSLTEDQERIDMLELKLQELHDKTVDARITNAERQLDQTKKLISDLLEKQEKKRTWEATLKNEISRLGQMLDNALVKTPTPPQSDSPAPLSSTYVHSLKMIDDVPLLSPVKSSWDVVPLPSSFDQLPPTRSAAQDETMGRSVSMAAKLLVSRINSLQKQVESARDNTVRMSHERLEKRREIAETLSQSHDRLSEKLSQTIVPSKPLPHPFIESSMELLRPTLEDHLPEIIPLERHDTRLEGSSSSVDELFNSSETLINQSMQRLDIEENVKSITDYVEVDNEERRLTGVSPIILIPDDDEDQDDIVVDDKQLEVEPGQFKESASLPPAIVPLPFATTEKPLTEEEKADLVTDLIWKDLINDEMVNISPQINQVPETVVVAAEPVATTTAAPNPEPAANLIENIVAVSELLAPPEEDENIEKVLEMVIRDQLPKGKPVHPMLLRLAQDCVHEIRQQVSQKESETPLLTQRSIPDQVKYSDVARKWIHAPINLDQLISSEIRQEERDWTRFDLHHDAVSQAVFDLIWDDCLSDLIHGISVFVH